MGCRISLQLRASRKGGMYFELRRISCYSRNRAKDSTNLKLTGFRPLVVCSSKLSRFSETSCSSKTGSLGGEIVLGGGVVFGGEIVLGGACDFFLRYDASGCQVQFLRN